MYLKGLTAQHGGKRVAAPMGERFFEATKHYNGRTRPAISDRKLRSGITVGRDAGASQHNGSLSGQLTPVRVFVTAFTSQI